MISLCTIGHNRLGFHKKKQCGNNFFEVINECFNKSKVIHTEPFSSSVLYFTYNGLRYTIPCGTNINDVYFVD